MPDFIWCDGEYLRWEDAKVHCLSQTFQYGFGVFEGLRSYATKRGPAIFRLRDHTDRLFQSANILNIKIPFSKDELNKVQCSIVAKNNLSNAYIRPIVYLDNEFLGLHSEMNSVHVMIAIIEWKNTYMSAEKFTNGVSLKTASYERTSIRNGLNQAKANGAYMVSILASNEVRSAGFDDALMLDTHGFVAEGNAANIFMVKDNQLYTPPLTFALDGITRRSIMTIANTLGISVAEKQITREALYAADEVFLTGTASEVLPVTSIDRRHIANNQRGKITAALQKHYFSIVNGKQPAYNRWLSFVETKQLAGETIQ